MVSRWVGTAFVIAVLLAVALQTGIVARTGFLMGDFRAFYCAARVTYDGADPYHTEPLRSCEVAIGATPFFEKNRGVVIPAPLPPYAIAMLVPLGRLPFAVAATLWAAALLCGLIASIATLSRFAKIPPLTAMAAVALPLAMLSLPFGEIVPLSLAFICLAADFASRRRTLPAALMGAAAMIEPHLGLPVCIALAIALPATRRTLAAAFAVLALLALGSTGVTTNLEYFARVLPAHALSEVMRDTQLSLTAVLSAIGVAPELAVRAGALWYAAMIAVGVLVGRRLARRTGNDAFLVCVPPAFAVFGGTFIHVTQIAAAIPAAVLLLESSARRYRFPVFIALLLLAVPWDGVVSPVLIVAPLVPIAYLAWWYCKGNVRAVLLATLAASALAFALLESIPLVPHAAPHVILPPIDSDLAQRAWSRFTQSSSTHSLSSWMLRLPTWSGLAVLLALLVREAGLHWRRWMPAPAVAIALLCTLLPFAGQLYGDRATRSLGIDVHAYYCAALAQREGANPYFAQPLHQCEESAPAPFYRPPQRVTVPAPYPPYVLAWLSPLTYLPFPVAAFMWLLAMIAILVLAAWALATVARQPLMVGWAALALSAGLTTLSGGNLLPFALASLILAALCTVRERPTLAAVAVGAAMVEPHVALPAAIALAIGYSGARVPLAIVLCALAAISLESAGFGQTLAYLTSVVPAHALAEVSRDNQYSLSTVIAALGLPDRSAAFAGVLSYALMTAAGVAIALRLAGQYRDAALIVLVPPAFAVLGGSFVHLVEIAVAVPACLLLYGHATAYRGWLFASLLLLAVPALFAGSLALFLAPIFPVAYLTYTLWRPDRTIALRAALVAGVVIAALFSIAATTPPQTVGSGHVYPPMDPRLAEASWRAFVLGNSTNRPVTWLFRLPTWIGLVGFVLSAAMLARRPRLDLRGERALPAWGSRA